MGIKRKDYEANVILFRKHSLLAIKSCFLLFFLISTSVLQAQKKEKHKKDSIYIRTFVDPMVFKANLDFSTQEFHTRDRDGKGLNLQSNENIRTSVSVAYRYLGFAIGFAPKFLPLNNDDDLKGETKIRSLGAFINHPKWQLRVNYTRIKGYYVLNTIDQIPDWEQGDPFVILPDIESTKFNASIKYVANNKRFSLKALTNQTEDQIKSAGSFLPEFQYRHSRIHQGGNTGVGNAPISDFHDLIAKVGYQYTWVIHKNFYASLGISIGGGLKLIYDKEFTGDRISTNVYPELGLDSNLFIGYNSTRWQAGVRNIGSTFVYNDKRNETSLEDSTAYFLFFAAYRFSAPKKVGKFMNSVEKGLSFKK